MYRWFPDRGSRGNVLEDEQTGLRSQRRNAEGWFDMLKILLSGACGRMGRQVAQLSEDEQAVIVAGVDVRAEKWSDFPVYPSFSLVQEEADVIQSGLWRG